MDEPPSSPPAMPPVAEPDNPPVVDDGTVNANVVASRTNGVAPLAVLFDATGTTGGGRPFHSLQYSWTFGDANAGHWAETGHSKNSATGGVAGHVFDKPGTYKVSLSARNGASAGDTAEVTVTVQDPETVFATSTYCFSTGTDFTGCPAAATKVTTSDTDRIGSYAAAGRRLLLRRGDNWTVTSSLGLAGKGPGTLGAFGSCTAPDARGLCTNAPVLRSTASDIAVITVAEDWRVMDLKLTGITGQSGQMAVSVGSGTGTLMYRMQTVNFNTAIMATFWLVDQDQLALVDSNIGQAYTNQVYIGAERLMIMGNHIHDSQLSHVLRVWHAYKSTISENLIENSSVASELGRQALKLHGFAEGSGGEESGLTDGTTPNGGPLHRTQFVNISDNTFGASPPWPVSVGPQNAQSDERVSDVVFERNFWRSTGTISPSAPPLYTPLHCTAVGDISVRNNIFDATGAASDYAAMDADRPTLGPATVPNIHFLNNLVYRSDAVQNDMRMLRVSDAMRDTHMRNNLGVAPGYTATSGATIIDNSGAGTVVSSNAYISNPGFAVARPLAPLDFRPTASAGSIDKGTAGPVIDDYQRTLRPAGGAPDLGPFEYQAP